jgi:hypothetical protein
MKKLLGFIVILLFSVMSYGQTKTKINTNDLIGYWAPNEESTQLFFWKDVHGVLQSQEISCTSGDPLDLISLRVMDNSIFIREIFLPNNWVTESVLTFIDKKTLKRVISGDAQGTIIYTKIK